jgi:hypothetical protein
MQRRNKRSAIVFPPIVFVLRSPAAAFVHPFTRKAGNKICEVEVCSTPFGSTQRLRFDVLNMRRFLLNPTHCISAKATLLLY